MNTYRKPEDFVSLLINVDLGIHSQICFIHYNKKPKESNQSSHLANLYKHINVNVLNLNKWFGQMFLLT